jgi:hypothetical protein
MVVAVLAGGPSSDGSSQRLFCGLLSCTLSASIKRERPDPGLPFCEVASRRFWHGLAEAFTKLYCFRNYVDAASGGGCGFGHLSYF